MANTVQFNAHFPDISASNALYERALQVQKPVTQTLAKGPGQFSKGVAPIYLQKGKGAHVWDVDGNEYIDYNAAIGPVSLGYAYPVVDHAIRRQLEDGITFSLMSPLEVELSELIQEVIPNAEAVKIAKTGADVCSAAVRVALRLYRQGQSILLWLSWLARLVYRYYQQACRHTGCCKGHDLYFRV